MIFTKQTGTYNLSQWESNDRIMMKDFNADNMKIEAALVAEAEARQAADAVLVSQSCYVKLLDLTLAKDIQTWDIDTSGINLTQYQKLLIYPQFYSNTNSSIQLRFGNISSSVYTINGNEKDYCADFYSAPNGYTELNLCTNGSKIFVSCQFFNVYNSTSITYGNIDSSYFGETGPNTLRFFKWADGTISANSRICIYGIKK